MEEDKCTTFRTKKDQKTENIEVFLNGKYELKPDD